MTFRPRAASASASWRSNHLVDPDGDIVLIRIRIHVQLASFSWASFQATRITKFFHRHCTCLNPSFFFIAFTQRTCQFRE